ncbi:hypothetical protein Fmac_004036 [Flemingia macrophylla]|uniref:Uncharacterized protein n=1 Tax=Flemingia macrophylla TaxID=520843 RepID=A0ABD1N4D1_9FABA
MDQFEMEVGDGEEERKGVGYSLETPNPECEGETPVSDGVTFNNQREILRAIEVVERDSLAIAQVTLLSSPPSDWHSPNLPPPRSSTCSASPTPPVAFRNLCSMQQPRGIAI